MKDLTKIDLTEIFNDTERVNWRDRFSEEECQQLIENTFTMIGKFNILYCDLNDAEYDGEFEVGCLLCDCGFKTESGFHKHVRAAHFPQFEKIYSLAEDETRRLIPSDKKHKQIRIDGVLVSMQITPKFAKNGSDLLGWSLHAVSENGLQIHKFLIGDNVYEPFVFHEAEDFVKEEMEKKKRADEFDRIFARYLELRADDRGGVAASVMGMMQNRMTDKDLEAFEAQIVQATEARNEYEAERKAELDRQHEIIDAAEAADLPTIADLTAKKEKLDAELKNACEEEVDVSDCCHKDYECYQPPLRSIVQDSPDDPYCVCVACGQKCEIVTLTKKELEDK